MTSLIDIRPSKDGRPWEIDACPLAYEEAARVQFKDMPGVKWHPCEDAPNGRGVYRGPRDALEIVLATLEAARVIKVANTVLPERIVDFWQQGPLPPDLFPYQQEGATWCAMMMRAEGGAILADEMGIGKTPQAIVAADLAFPTGVRVVVCPAVVVTHWLRLLRTWSRDRTQWHVYSHEKFRVAHSRGLLPGGAVAFVIDEGHYFSNPKAARTKAAREWLAMQPTRPAVLMTTGTPMTTEPHTLHEPLDLVFPGRFGTAWQFQKRYCDGKMVDIPRLDKKVWDCSGISRPDELATRLRSVMLRRTKADVALQLPSRTRTVHEVELPAKARKALQRAARALAMDPRQGVQSLLSHAEEYKVEAAIELAKELMRLGGAPLILTTRKATAADVGKALACPVADGDVPPDERQKLLHGQPCGAATVYAVTTGIDLTSYDSIIFVGLDWVPSTLLQAEARIHRIGQSRAVGMHYLVAQGTLDEVVRDRVLARLDAFGKIIGEGDQTAFAADFGPGTEDELLASLVVAMKEAA